ncbi:MAG: hypothetical protein ACM31L_16495 [Actinomycetota bacterium]
MHTTSVLAGVAALAATLVPTLASAQWNDQPWNFPGGVGMSMAARQAILQQHIDGIRPDNLYRGPDGQLLTVVRKGDQAFLTEPQPYYVVGAPTSGQAYVQAGFGGVSLGLGTSAMAWPLMLEGARVAVAPYGPRLSSSPVDAWTRQLDGLGAVE